MTTYYCGPGGNNANSGASYALRKLTLTGVEALALVGGDRVWVAPGTFRETLIPAKSGGSLYATGTVSVTNGSKTVTGSGTTFSGGSGAFADGVFQVTQIAHGTDGVTNGTGTFTSAAGNFQSSMIGLTIRISTKIAAIISAVASVTSITLTDPAGVAVAPSAGTALTYDVGPESPYRIASVDSATQLTLARPWSGPTLTGVAYSTWQDIRYSADLTGQNTDGVGGMVRITGSDNDQTANRASCIQTPAFNYRTFQGFALDGASGTNGCFYNSANATFANWIIEDCFAQCHTGGFLLSGAGTVTNLTIRRCLMIGGRSVTITFVTASPTDNNAILIENCAFVGGSLQGLLATRVGGILLRSSLILLMGAEAIRNTVALTVGQAITVNNCIVTTCVTAMRATAVSEIIEDYNTLAANGTDRTSVTIGQHSNAFLPFFQPLALFANGRTEPWLPFSLQTIAGQRNKAGLFPPATDLYGTPRPQEADSDWGAVEALPLAVTNTNAGTNEYAIPGRGYLDFLIPVLTGLTYTMTVGVRWDNNANVGVKPSMTLLADYGVAETSVSAVGTGSLETLTISSITPTVNTAEPGGVMVLRLLNNSTFATVINAYFSSVSVV